MNSTRLIIYILSAFNVGLFIVLAYLALGGWRKIVNRYYFGLIISIVVWLILTNYQGITHIVGFINKMNFLAASSVVLFFSLFTFELGYKRKGNNFVVPLYFGIFSFLTFLSLSNIIISENTVSYEPINSKIWYSIYIFVLSLLAVGFGGKNLVSQWRTTEGIKKQQVSYLLFGFTVPFLALILLSLYNALIQTVSDDAFSMISNVGIIFALLCSRAIFRYRFLDIRVVLQRSIVRAVSFLTLLVVYLLLVLVLRDTLISETKQLNPTSLIVVGLLIILTVEPLRKYIYNFVDKRFELHDKQQERIQKQLQIVLKSQRSLSDLEQAIRKAFQGTASVDTVDYFDADDQNIIGKPALRAFLQSTGKIVICEELAYRLDEDPRFKQVNDEVKNGSATVYVPIGQNEIFVGCFVLGQRKGKVAYSAQEVSAMKLLQSQATEAFLNARLYKQAVERININR